MKTLGIIGGTGPDTTIEYYRMIIASYRSQKQDGSYPTIIINSIDLKTLVDLITANQLAQLTNYLLEEVRKLAAAGADFGLLAANTPHLVFNELSRQSPIPLISIVEATCDAVLELGLTRVALFGTRFTMQAQFYPEVFTPKGITLITPTLPEQEYIHDKYMNELLKGIFLPETHAKLLTIVDELKEKEEIEGLILAGTELSLILREDSYKGIPFFDTAKIHVQRVIAEMLS